MRRRGASVPEAPHLYTADASTDLSNTHTHAHTHTHTHRYHASPFMGAPQLPRDTLLIHRGRMGERDLPMYSRGVRQKVCLICACVCVCVCVRALFGGVHGRGGEPWLGATAFIARRPESNTTPWPRPHPRPHRSCGWPRTATGGGAITSAWAPTSTWTATTGDCRWPPARAWPH